MLHNWVKTTIFILAVIWVAWSLSSSPAPTSDVAYVNALYTAILNREPDQSGLDNSIAALKSGKISRNQLLDNFLHSPEYIGRRGR